jgi:DNA topoisomerase-1
MLRQTRDSQRGSDAADVQISAATAEAIAECDDLRYSSDVEPGIRRRRAGNGFFYVDPAGRRITDEATLSRIRKLAVPPAYRDVWICRDARGHMQATGIDARGRKQYRYHERWRSVRDAHKFERMMAFGKALPRIHRRISRDLKVPGLPREKVVATVVRLLEATLIRVGNDEYARTNKSYGLTTMRNKHVVVKGSTVRFTFRGKHGIKHDVAVEDPRIAKILKQCVELPGQELFGYVDENGTLHDVSSSDVNDYLKNVAGEAFTAKDFRTWHATSSALAALAGRTFRTASESKALLKTALEAVAGRLGNTVTMCRKCYVNPVVVDAFLAGELREVSLSRNRDERVRLLQILTDTPAGAGFGSARSKAGAKVAPSRASSRTSARRKR